MCVCVCIYIYIYYIKKNHFVLENNVFYKKTKGTTNLHGSMGDIGLWIGVGLLPNLVCVCVCVCVSYFFFKILIKEYWSLDWDGASSKLGIYIHMFNIYICSFFEKTKCSMYISLWVVFFLENSQKSYI